jgi:hypothetical protein
MVRFAGLNHCAILDVFVKSFVTDIDQKQLAELQLKLKDANIQVLACPLDVTNYQKLSWVSS